TECSSTGPGPCGEDLSEVRVVNISVRVSERRRVAQIERLRPELQTELLRQFEGAEQAQVHVHHTGSAHGVPTHGAEPDVRDPRKRAGIEEGAIVSDLAQLGDRGLNLVRGLLVARHVQRAAGSGQRILRSLESTEDAVDLPASQDRFAGTAPGPL